MRTTVDIRDELLARARELATAQQRKVSDLVNDALAEVLARAAKPRTATEPYRVVPLPGDGAFPHIDFSDNGSIQDAMDDECRDPVTGELDFDKLR